MRKVVLFLLTFIFCTAIHAQDGFIKSYDLGFPAVTFSNNIILAHDTLVVAGIAANTTSPFRQGIFLAKIDTNGNVISVAFHLDEMGGNYTPDVPPVDLIRLSDGSGYMLLGHVFERGNGIIMKLKNDGSQQWVREFPDVNSLHDSYRRLVETENGLLVGGTKQTLDFSTSAFVMKIDHDGNKLWEASFGGGSKRYMLQSIVEVTDNEYVLGISTAKNLGTPWQDWEYSSIIWAIDSLGNEKWKWESESGMEEIEMSGLQQDDDGNWVYATFRGEHYTIGQSWQWTNVQPKFMIRDADFNLITEKNYDDIDGPSNTFKSLISLSDNDWLGVGGDFVEDAIVNNHTLARMVRISNEQPGFFQKGDSIWTRSDRLFPDSIVSSGQRLHSAVELSSGNIVAAGYASGIKDLGFLIKVNEHGCIAINECVPTNLNHLDNKTINPKLKVFPNPVDKILYYHSEIIPEWDRVELVDLTGNIIYNGIDKKRITVEGLLPGLYLLRLWYDNQFWVHKFVKI